MRGLVKIVVVAALAAASGCGASDATRGARPADAGPPPPPPLTVVDGPTARLMLVTAVRRASQRRRRFITVAAVPLRHGGTLRLTFDGSRDPGAGSTLVARRRALSFVPAPAFQVRRNWLRVRVDRRSSWRDLGSADGIALDVGREMLAHEPLLRVHRGLVRGDSSTIDVRVTSAALATQAAQDPSSPIATLLSRTSGVRATVYLGHGMLRCVRLASVIGLPARIGDRTADRFLRMLPRRATLSLVERDETARTCQGS